MVAVQVHAVPRDPDAFADTGLTSAAKAYSGDASSSHFAGAFPECAASAGAPLPPWAIPR